jgi:hypothetical protein
MPGLRILTGTEEPEVQTHLSCSEDFAQKSTPWGGTNATHNRTNQTISMPSHLHRRPPLRQPLPPQGRVLLLPPHHPKARRQPNPAPYPPLHLPPASARRPFRHPGLHRRSSPAHRRQPNRSPPRRPPPLRPPDRQPQPAQNANRHQTRRRTPNRRRDHHRPRSRNHRPAHRSLRGNRAKKHSGQTHRAHHAKRTAGPRRKHHAKRTIGSPTRTRHHPHPPGHRRQSPQPARTYKEGVIPT